MERLEPLMGALVATEAVVSMNVIYNDIYMYMGIKEFIVEMIG